MKLLIKLFTVLFLLVAILVLCWFNRVAWLGFDLYRVESVSMLPTLKPNTIVVVNLRIYQHQSPKVDDIIVLKDPQRPNQNLVKRITHLPGQSLQYIKTETQLDAATRTPMVVRRKITLNSIDGFFVQGDNPLHSTDSRSFGVVPKQSIIGKVIFYF